MSLPRDPFDLIETGNNMDNIIPFLAPNKINQMVDNALLHQQLTPTRKPILLSKKTWWTSGISVAACIILLLTILSPNAITPISSEKTIVSTANEDDLNEFSELVMLETWERY